MATVARRSLPEASDPWEVQLRRGALELAILAAHWSGRLYGWEIIRRLGEERALNVPIGTIYPLLSRLKANGLLSAEWVETKGGHPRKYYQLTRAGRRRVVEMTRLWRSFAAGIDHLLAPVEIRRSSAFDAYGATSRPPLQKKET